MAPAVQIDKNFWELGFFCPTVRKGLELAKAVIETARYVDIVIDNLGDESKPSAAEVRAVIETLPIKATVIENAVHLDAYAVVYRTSCPNEIFFNPLLFMQIALAEKRGSTDQHLRSLSLFIAIKTVHQYSHLIHPRVSSTLRNQAKKRALGGDGKQKLTTPEKSKGGAMFGDFGEMVEYDLFGGISELYTTAKQPVAYSMGRIILFDHPGAREGHLVVVKNSDYVVTADLADLRLTVEEGTVDRPYRGPRGHLGITGGCLGPGERVESDVIELAENEREDGGAVMDPTF